MAVWEAVRDAMEAAHANAKEWLTVGEITKEVHARDASVNTGSIHAAARFYCINDPSNKHSPGLVFLNNPQFVTDDPSMHGKRYRLLTEAERQAFKSHPREDLSAISYAQLLEWLGDTSTPIEPDDVEDEDTSGIGVSDQVPGTALLELHLQDYVHRHWNDVFPNFRLHGNPNGREFRTADPAVGIIDFLCIDADENFVVIETKKDWADRKAVGQILAYMGWVQEKMCLKGQSVRGILLASEGSDQLKMAAKAMPNLDLYRYEISFKIEPASEG